jgi:hypothetical protein
MICLFLPLRALTQPGSPFIASLPTENLEHFLLDRGHFGFREPRIEHLVLRAVPGASQPEGLRNTGYFCFFELKSLPPHQEQCQNVSKIHAIRLGLAFEPAKTIEQQFIIKSGPDRAFRRRHFAGPKAERAVGPPGPTFAAVVLAKELATLVKKDAIELLARLKLSAGRETAPGIGLNLILCHAT